MDVVALLGTEFDDVAHTLRGQQAQRRAAALDQCVGDEGGAVYQFRHIGKLDARGYGQVTQALHGADRRIRRRGQVLVDADPIFHCVEQDEIGKRSADIEADPIAFGCCLRWLGNHFISMRRNIRFMPATRVFFAGSSKAGMSTRSDFA